MRMTKQDPSRPEVPLSPLIDCVFLLLIFFLVATTLKKIQPELPLELPTAAVALQVPQEQERLVISVDERGGIYLNASPVSLNLLHDTLKAAAQRDPNQVVRLDVDRRTPFQHVVHITELCTFVGLNNVGFQVVTPRQ
jgi:biopolymer transport protein ExbD